MNMDSQKRRDRETTDEHEEHVNPPKKRKLDSLLECALGTANVKQEMNMDSQKKRYRETPDEHKEHVNPPKKRKFNSLLLEIEKKNLVGLQNLVNNRADVKCTGHFSWNNLDFEEVPAIFAAIISDQESMVDFLAGKNPHFTLEKIIELSKSLDVKQKTELIDVLELVGAACIFYGDSDARKHGWNCWDLAMELRKVNGMPKHRLHLSELGRLAFRSQSEIMDSIELKALLKQRRVYWKTQAFFVSHRILTKYGLFPNNYIICNVYKFALEDWEKCDVDRSLAFSRSLYLVELFKNFSFEASIKNDQPSPSVDVINWTLVELNKVLEDRIWVQSSLKEVNSVLTMEHVMTCLNFITRHPSTLINEASSNNKQPQSGQRDQQNFESELKYPQQLKHRLTELANQIMCRQTTFDDAVISGSSVNLVCFLKTNGLPVTAKLANTKNSLGETPLLTAIQNRCLDTAKYLVDNLNVPLFETGNFFWNGTRHKDLPPIIAAAISGQTAIVKHFVSIDSSINSHLHTIEKSCVSKLEKIARFELLGAIFILQGEVWQWIEFALPLWERATMNRGISFTGEPRIPKGENFSELKEYFNPYTEFSTIRELKDMFNRLIDESNSTLLSLEEKMIFAQANLVSLRILKSISPGISLYSIIHMHNFLCLYFPRSTSILQLKSALTTSQTLLKLTQTNQLKDIEENSKTIYILKVIATCLQSIQLRGNDHLLSLGITCRELLRFIDSTFICQRKQSIKNFETIEDIRIEECLTKFIMTMIELVFKSDDNKEAVRMLAAFVRLDGIALVNKITGKSVRDVFLLKHRQNLNQTKPDRCLESVLKNPESLTCLAVQSIWKNKVSVEDSQLPSTLIWFLKRH